MSGSVSVPPARQTGRALPRRRILGPAWPVSFLLIGYPLWWGLGLADFMWVILAVPMLLRMTAWHAWGGRRIRVPPGFGLWILFLVIAVAGIATLSLTAPGTVPSSLTNRLLSYTNRTASYVGLTVLLLFAGNLTEAELPRRRLAWMLGLVGIFTVAGGLAGMVLPHLQFSSPAYLLLPKGAQANSFIQASMQPGLSQVQNVLGNPAGRPKAPFDYTNTWGDCLTILLPFLIAGWWHDGSRRQRLIAGGTVLAALVPLLYSLNRAAWIGAGLSAGYLAVRFAARRKFTLLGVLSLVVAVAALAVFLTPLRGEISGRLANGKSNNLRANLSSLSLTAGLSSPVIGYGDTRQEQGSPRSIAIGPSRKCPACGQLALGSTGQLWLLLVCNGITGAACYLGFFACGLWRFRRDFSPYGLAGVLVLLLSFIYMFTYDAVGAPLGLTMLAYALVWKNDLHRRAAAPLVSSGPGAGASPGPDQGAGPGEIELADFLTDSMPMPAVDRAGVEVTPAAPRHQHYDGRGSGPGLGNIARDGVLNLAGALISAGAGVGVTIIVARAFPAPVAGAFFVATSLFLIVEATANLGAYNGTIYFIARFRALRAERRIPAIIRAAIIPVALSAVAGAAALIVFAAPLARLLLNGRAGGISADEVATALRALAVALPFAALADTLLGATRGYREMRPTVAVDRVGRAGLQLLGVAAAALAGGTALLAPLWALPYLPASIVALWWLRRVMRRQRLRTAPADGRATAGQPRAHPEAGDNRHGPPNARGFWTFTAPRSIAAVAQIVIQRLDIVLVGIMRGPAEAAIYTAATRFLVAGQLGNSAISMAAQPRLTHLFAIHDPRGARTVYQLTTAWLILLTWPLYLLAIGFGPGVLAIFGTGYHSGREVMIILGLAMLLATACGQVDLVLVTAGRSGWSLLNGLTAMGVNIGADLVLIPRLGISGAAIGWAAAIGLSNLLPLVQVAATAGLHPFGRGTAAAIGITTVSFAVIPIAARAAAGSATVVLVLATVAGCAVMAAGTWWLRGTFQFPARPGPGERSGGRGRVAALARVTAAPER